jgi:hypothetical protein
VDALKPLRTYTFLSFIMLFVPALLLPASVATATGHFEVYCDGVGIFLARIDGAPAPGKLVLFSRNKFSTWHHWMSLFRRTQEIIAARGLFNESPTYRSVADGSSIALSPWCSNAFSLEKRVMQSFAFR